MLNLPHLAGSWWMSSCLSHFSCLGTVGLHSLPGRTLSCWPWLPAHSWCRAVSSCCSLLLHPRWFQESTSLEQICCVISLSVLLEKESNENFVVLLMVRGFCCFYYLKKAQRNGFLAFSMIFKCQADEELQLSTVLPISFFFFGQPLLCCAVELEDPDATPALNISAKCKSKRNAAAVPPPLIVSGALLSPGPVTFGLHHADLHTACYCLWTRQHWKENSNLVLLLIF